MSKKNVVGIDLGTSFSSIARLDQYGRPEVLPNAEGEQMTPSAVYYGEEGPVVGKEAMKSGSDDPERLVENAKRFLGSSFGGWTVDGKRITPLESLTQILRKLKTETEEQIGPLDGAVISVPVHYNIQQRELTIQGAKRAGFQVLGLVNEPVAGALTFILGEQGLAYAALADEQTILVYDLGGGTFDLSIVHYSEEGIDVKAATGEMKLGGIDWNQRLIDLIAQRFWDLRGYDIRRDPKMLRKLAENIEEAKRSLSNPKKPFTNVSIRYEGYSESMKITREEFEEISRDLVERTRKLTEGLVRSTVRRWDLLNQVLPVGGATRMPMIREAIRQMCLKTMGEVFGLEPNYRLSPDLAIAQGAALYAGLLAGDGPAGTEWAKQTYVPKMISTHGLGLAVRNKDGERVNHILIPAGSRLPAQVSVGVETVRKHQERIALKIVEAEDEKFRDEDVLLRCEINNLPPDLPEGSGFDVDLICEPSGLLQVVARHRDTGRIATARLKRDMSQFGEVVESESIEGDPTRQETLAVGASSQSAGPEDALFGADPSPVDFTEEPFEADKQTAAPPVDLLFDSQPPEQAPTASAPAFPAGVVFEHAAPVYESVESGPLSFEAQKEEEQKLEAVPAPVSKDPTEFDDSTTIHDSETAGAPAEEQWAELASENEQTEELEPIMLDFVEEEEVVALEAVEEPLPLEPVDELLPMDDGLELLPLEDEPPPQPKSKKLTPPSKQKGREEPEPLKSKKLTPLSKQKKRDDPPLPLD
jgi:molecular chaperone DnaK